MKKLKIRIMKKERQPFKLFPRHHDLDGLAGTWSEADEESFNRNIEPFEKIDEEMWE